MKRWQSQEGSGALPEAVAKLKPFQLKNRLKRRQYRQLHIPGNSY